MASSNLRDTHEIFQEALRANPRPPGASLCIDPPIQFPMTYAIVASPSPGWPVSLPMESPAEVRAGAWRLQQIAHQMYLIRAWYPACDHPNTPHTAEWISARVRHARMLRELEQGLVNYQAHGLCRVQYLDMENTTPTSDQHEIRVEEGVRTYEVYGGHLLLHYRKVLRFQFVDTLHLGTENPNLYLNPQFCPMDAAHIGSHLWERDNDCQCCFQPPTSEPPPQVMPMGGSPLVPAPVQFPTPTMQAPLSSPPRPTQESEDREQSWHRYGENGNDADHEDEEPSWGEYGESANDADDEDEEPSCGGYRESTSANGTDDEDGGSDDSSLQKNYQEDAEDDTSEDESENEEESFHGFSPIHMSTAGIRYLHRPRTSHDGTSQVASSVHAASAVGTHDQALRSHPQLSFGADTGVNAGPGPGSSSNELWSESDGGCPVNWEDEHHDKDPGETGTTSYGNPNASPYMDIMTTSGGAALPGVDISEGRLPLHSFETMGFGQALPEEGNVQTQNMGYTKSQDGGLSGEDMEKSSHKAWYHGHSSIASHETPILLPLLSNHVTKPRLAVPHEPQESVFNNNLPHLQQVPGILHAQPTESSMSQPLTTSPPNCSVYRRQSSYFPRVDPTVAPTISLPVHADTVGRLGRSVMQSPGPGVLNMEERVRAMLKRQSSYPVRPSSTPALTPQGPCEIPARNDPGQAHEITPPPAYWPRQRPASCNNIEWRTPAAATVRIPEPAQLSRRQLLVERLGLLNETAVYIGSIRIVGRAGPTWCYQVGEDLLMLHDDGEGNVEPDWRCGVYANRNSAAAGRGAQ